MSTPEGKIQNAICKWLRSQHIFFFRVNNAPVFDARLGGYRGMGEFAMKGIPDIITIPPDGIFTGIEVKAPRGVQSADQKLFERRCLQNNGRYILARSLEDVIHTFETFKTLQTLKRE